MDLDLYHRTSVDAAREIVRTGEFRSRENTAEAYVSTNISGHAVGYGDAVVHVRVNEAAAQLEDEFPDGEQHYRVPIRGVQIVDAFMVTEDGQRGEGIEGPGSTNDSLSRVRRAAPARRPTPHHEHRHHDLNMGQSHERDL